MVVDPANQGTLEFEWATQNRKIVKWNLVPQGLLCLSKHLDLCYFNLINIIRPCGVQHSDFM